jgi:hypothetical protein
MTVEKSSDGYIVHMNDYEAHLFSSSLLHHSIEADSKGSTGFAKRLHDLWTDFNEKRVDAK